ncbi:hypothetical protein HMPREF0321_0317 [Dermacoccus sp. Ellin185]|nr:hypothetical protein HMPREF0321_0317 [Dermacoccus sp. Ellin185]
MGQPADNRAARGSFTATASAPAVGFDDSTGQDRTGGLEALTGGLKAELIQAAEHGQVRVGEGSVRHVEVFQMGSVRTSIIGRPRRLPGQRHAVRSLTTRYTLICEEPVSASKISMCCAGCSRRRQDAAAD